MTLTYGDHAHDDDSLLYHRVSTPILNLSRWSGSCALTSHRMEHDYGGYVCEPTVCHRSRCHRLPLINYHGNGDALNGQMSWIFHLYAISLLAPVNDSRSH
ncbi:hypothetical protein DPMN_173281 [Dreissena polymorpha]|uniref:Uncharacterized protein n=1 Tax=Dreissena polymorpha TaxID=45954 RepID=A0A9D4IGT2_DREPO|nr:hypothetical protein DPMN_173281 [Dreissena polymorpha]